MMLSPNDCWQLGQAVLALCEQAAGVVMDLYRQEIPIAVSHKSDTSPVTEADHRAHDLLASGLRALTPDYPVLSEEDRLPPFAEREGWHRYWLIDPLDGTREFIRGSGEFSINIALIENHCPVLGVIAAPAEATLYLGVPGVGAVRQCGGANTPIAVRNVAPTQLDVLTGHRRISPALTDCVEQLRSSFATIKINHLGSALKFCRLAEGRGDICPGLFRCYEWDIAAGQALLEAAGGALVDRQFQPVRYNRTESLLSPPFFALGGQNVAWSSLLRSSD